MTCGAVGACQALSRALALPRSFSAYNYSGQDSVLQTWATGALRSTWIPLSSDWPAVMLHICCTGTLEADTGGSLI